MWKQACMYVGAGVLLAAFACGASGPRAEGIFVPPSMEKAGPSPFSVESLERWVDAVQAVQTIDLYEGKNDALRAEALARKNGALRGGALVPLGLNADELFGPPIQDANEWVFLGSLISVDAVGVRIQMDLSALQPDAELWLIDPNVPRASGPYTTEDCGEGGCWLSTVLGEEAVLMVRTPQQELPSLRLTAYAHIFLTFADLEKELSCNVDIGCDSREDVRRAGTATAIINVSGEWFCSGFLLNNPKTDLREPYFMTANHCICSGAQARATEAYWDYRATGCDTEDEPDTDTLSRSNGTALLATDAALDITLIRLDAIPTGDYGRAYLGWDTDPPEENEAVLTIHYPDSTRQRVTKGTVKSINHKLSGRKKLTEVHWDEGVTEAGSSGAPLLLDEDLSVVGTLSMGPQHTCGSDRAGNIDYYSSFRDFYPDIRKYIDTNTPASGEGDDDCREFSLDCPSIIAFANYPGMIDNLRAVRDRALKTTALGRTLTRAYYAMAPNMADAMRRSTEARGMFIAVVSPFARVGAALTWIEG